MPLAEIAPPLKGELNTNYLLGENASQPPTHLLRAPRRNDAIFESIDHEYNFIGFTGLGGRYRRRTPQEQSNFAVKAALSGLKVLPPIYGNGTDYTFAFLSEIETLDTFLSGANKGDAEEFIVDIFKDLRKAHAGGVIYGDRWSKNILRSGKYGLVHVDFDLELSGSPAVEFEVAQVTYYTLSCGKEKIIPILAKLLLDSPWFNFETIKQFLRGHAAHFNNTPYGGIISETETLICIVNKLNEEKHK
ncbi:MAG: hypothetical protein UY10_C0025G0006 [Microgenomates group bacterium GW2011_GWA2_47_8]|nr:MAG: hypothetical protein UY10_C0025G0006 [Microgenomates group bacterium GW2011_GWA2_47_8]